MVKGPANEFDRTKSTLKIRRSEGGSVAPPTLVQLSGSGAVRRFLLESEITRIGRDGATNEIVLDDPWVSRSHSRIVLHAFGARLEDCSSRNGCLVNSEKVDELELRDGDLIQIGHATFKFLQAGSAEAPFYQEVFRLAFRDPVTGTYSRRYFDEALARELLRAARQETPLSILLIDLDDFKQVNDTFGHKVGDVVLAETAAIIQGALRGESITARFGGDEFVVLLPTSGLEEAAAVAERLRRRFESEPPPSCPESMRVTLSIGVAATRSDGGHSAEDLLQAADQALYRAKRAGRNQVACG
jgi:diguanylate cyclase (GGDEF)-like protein